VFLNIFLLNKQKLGLGQKSHRQKPPGVYEELENDDAEKVREVYKACLDVIPHKSFTFAKVWLLFAAPSDKSFLGKSPHWK
jgi:hypothetical protein